MKKYGLNRHAVIKLALRRFLFPDEKTSIPLNGYNATVRDDSVNVEPSSDPEKPKLPFILNIEPEKDDDFPF